jgi:ABC-type lipoprotein release transport system permease subunit
MQNPWLNLALIIDVAYEASLFTTFLPARQAAHVYSAEALRYELQGGRRQGLRGR